MLRGFPPEQRKEAGQLTPTLSGLPLSNTEAAMAFSRLVVAQPVQAGANCSFGGDGRTPFITAGDRLMRIRAKVSGVRWTCWAGTGSDRPYVARIPLSSSLR